MKQGPTERQVIETCKKRGTPLPDALANCPAMFLGLEDYYSAFWNLNTDRPIGMAAGQIPWSSIDRYAQREGMDDEEFDRFLYIIRKMDTAWMEHTYPPKAD